MPVFVRLIGLAFVCLSLASPSFALESPSRNDLEQQLAQLPSRNLGEAELNSAKSQLELALSQVEAQQAVKDQISQLQQLIAQAPEQILQSRRLLAELQQAPPPRPSSNASLEELENALSQIQAQLAQAQQALSDANSMQINAQARPERAPAEISNLQQQLSQIEAQLRSSDTRQPLSAEQRARLLSDYALLNAQLDLQRQTLAANNLLLDLSSARHALLEMQIKRLDQQRLLLEKQASALRINLSAETLAEVSREARQLDPNSLLSRESAVNLAISQQLLKSTEARNSFSAANLRAQQQLETLSRSEHNLDEQVKVLAGSQLLARVLYEQKQALPKIKLLEDLPSQIAEIRLQQIKLNQQRNQLNNLDSYLDELIDQDAAPSQRNDLSNLLHTRQGLLEQLSSELNAQLSEAINLQLNQQLLQTRVSALQATLSEQMFWVPSNSPMNLEWFEKAPQRLQQQLSDMQWQTNLSNLFSALLKRPWLFLPLLLMVGVLLYKRRWIINKLQQLHQDIGKVKRDSYLHTPFAVLLNILLALPVTLLLALGGVALRLDGVGQNPLFGSALLEMALCWLVFYTLMRLLNPGGVAQTHFRWPSTQVAYLRKQVLRLGAIAMALMAVVTVAEHQPQALSDDVLGVITVIIGFALLALWQYRLLLGHKAQEERSPFRLLLGIALTLVPLALLVAVLFGYYYTALKLTERLIETLYLLIIWLVLEAVLERSLSLAAQRLAFKRAQDKGQEQLNTGLEGEVLQEEPRLAIAEVNQQSLRLMHLALGSTLLLCLYWLWADLIGVFNYLDTITLYQYNSGSADSPVLTPLSLFDLLVGLIILVLTIVLSRNLPGLLEVLVLSRLKLAQGSAYATTSLLSYIIFAVGAVATLGAFGVSWDKLQWLVAALSVGIGFGMQEIFANFISGLILLFERPIRIGDTVTIGNLTGTVSRIRIRATTIVDGDRKEIIVPNKTFITGQLLNWSLSDTVTRITIAVGVGYGSDLELVRKLLLQVALDNPRVLRDPAPSAYFLAFGANSLDHELRVHVSTLGDRTVAIDELNRAINQAFNQHNIEMPFPQLDVHLRPDQPAS